jgi:hypothetical protein
MSETARHRESMSESTERSSNASKAPRLGSCPGSRFTPGKTWPEIKPVPSPIKWLPPGVKRVSGVTVTDTIRGESTHHELWEWYENAPLEKPSKPVTIRVVSCLREFREKVGKLISHILVGMERTNNLQGKERVSFSRGPAAPTNTHAKAGTTEKTVIGEDDGRQNPKHAREGRNVGAGQGEV